MDDYVGNYNDNDESEPEIVEDEESGEERRASDAARVTRSGRVSRPHDWKTKFPETAHVQVEDDKIKWLKPCCHDCEDTKEKLGAGDYCHESYFSDDVTTKEVTKIVDIDGDVKG